MIKIIPAILTKSIIDLNNKFEKIQGIADWVQIDFMDGRFVKNQSIGIKDLSNIKTNLNLEAHLMVFNPEKYLQDAKLANFKRIIFHFEAVDNVSNVLDKIHNFGFESGIAINPQTSPEKLSSYLKNINLVLLLGVNPGFSGQEFISSILNKVEILKNINSKIKIGIDGGINLANIAKITQTNVDYLIIGSGLFNANNIIKRFEQLKQKII